MAVDKNILGLLTKPKELEWKSCIYVEKGCHLMEHLNRKLLR